MPRTIRSFWAIWWAKSIFSSGIHRLAATPARTIKVATIEPDGLLVLFDDQSSMKIKTAAAPAASPGGKIKSVHEAKAEFKIEFEDGSSATFCLADPGSSVAVRDKNHAVEYLG